MDDDITLKKGDSIEVCSNEEGLKGSYYKATIISTSDEKGYTVQYETLLNEDESGPLIEVVPKNEVRPFPPIRRVSWEFSKGHIVDAYDNEGWWVGHITGKKKKGDMYGVHFENNESELFYHYDDLRFHVEWISGVKWVHSGKKDV